MKAGLTLALAGLVAGCSWFESEEERLPGERIRLRDQSAGAVGLQLGASAPALPAERTVAEWTQTNGAASHHSGHLGGPSAPRLAWKVDAGAGGQITGAPIVVGGRVFALDASAQLSAFDAGTGALAWRVSLAPANEDGEDGYGGGLAAEGGRIFATTGFGEILSITAATGDVAWRYRANAPFRAAPAVEGGVVVAVTRDNEAIALNGLDGTLRWRIAGIAARAGLLGGASPAISGGLAVVPFASGEVMGVDIRNGRQVWSAVLGGARRGQARGSITDVSGDPVIIGRAVVAANHSGRMAAIDGQSGRRGWTRSFGSTGPIWAAGESIYVVTDAAELVRVAVSTGQTIWRTELPAFEDPEDREDPIAYSGPVLAGGRLYVTDSTGNLLSFDPGTGTQGPTVELSDGTTTGVVVARGALYVLSSDGALQAFR